MGGAKLIFGAISDQLIVSLNILGRFQDHGLRALYPSKVAPGRCVACQVCEVCYI